MTRNTDPVPPHVFVLLWYSVSSSLGVVGTVCYFSSDLFPNPAGVIVMGEWLMALGAVGIFAMMQTRYWLKKL
jgi:hypothetical protein